MNSKPYTGTMLSDLMRTVECVCTDNGIYCESCKVRFAASRYIQSKRTAEDEMEYLRRTR